MSGDEQYLALVRRVLEEGKVSGDRTGVGTKRVFGHMARYDLAEGFPLLTTKRVFWRGVVEELLWFISGSTDARVLQAKGVHIWDGNSTKEFLEKRGLGHRAEGDLGPVYGFQWRHWGAQYVDFETDYTGRGLDQLQTLIKGLREDPTSRRHLMSAWNPDDVGQMALPPCHLLAQFYVEEGRLSCMLTQRSADVGLGVPFNIASYALLTHLIAATLGLGVGELVHVTGDTHVYLNHEEGLRVQLGREARPPATLRIVRQTSIDDYRPEHIVLEGYNPHPLIKLPFAA